MILGNEQYHNLEHAFQDRSHPKLTRISYALAAEEDDILQKLLRSLEPEANTHPIVLLFDGAILRVQSSDDFEKIKDVVKTFEKSLKLEFSINVL